MNHDQDYSENKQEYNKKIYHLMHNYFLET